MSLSSSRLREALTAPRPLAIGEVGALRRHGASKNRLHHTVLGPDETCDLEDLLRDCQERLKPNPKTFYRPALPRKTGYVVGSILVTAGLIVGMFVAVWLAGGN